MKRRKQIGKLIYTPKWDQGDIELSQDYEGLSRDEKLEVLAHWITGLLCTRNAMIPNPQSWHHFMDKKKWVGLTDEEVEQLAVDAGIVTWVKRVYDDVDKKFYDLPLGEGMEGDGISLKQFADLISTRLKELNT